MIPLTVTMQAEILKEYTYNTGNYIAPIPLAPTALNHLVLPDAVAAQRLACTNAMVKDVHIH